MMKVIKMPSNPPGANPFDIDLTRMGTRLGANLIAMHMNHTDKECQHVVLVNTKTGERIGIQLEEATGWFDLNTDES